MRKSQNDIREITFKKPLKPIIPFHYLFPPQTRFVSHTYTISSHPVVAAHPGSPHNR